MFPVPVPIWRKFSLFLVEVEFQMMSSSLLAFPTVTGTTVSSEHITAVMATTDGKYSA